MQYLFGVVSSVHLVGQINGLKRAHRYGFTLHVITVEDIAESADSNLFKSLTQSNHCLHFLLPLLRIRYTLSALKVIQYQLSSHQTQLLVT